MAPRANWKGGSTEQLRRDIDSGRTGDKVDWPDQAQAPLGTDDEAAGTPPSRERVRLARRQELSRGPKVSHGRARTKSVRHPKAIGALRPNDAG